MGAQTRSGVGLPSDVTFPDRYRVLRRVAHGGMASVWCADDTALGRKVAIKLLAEQYAHDDASIRRFKREARAAARLSSHPHVVTIFDVGEAGATDDGAPGRRPFIVMEYLSGGTVADALRVGAVGRDETLGWLRQAAEALDYAHAQGIVHRDIKPGNLLLDSDRRLHVADFGIARVATEDTITATGQLFGTAAYLSPEQALGEPATAAGDRYAFAVVAFELLVGRRPFTADGFAGQARQHIEADPPRASELRPELGEVVDGVMRRGMAKRPEDRWPSAGEFVDALVRALRPRPRTAATRRMAAAAPPPRIVSSRSRRAPSPRVVALAALAAGAFGIGATAGAISGAGSSSPSRSDARASKPDRAPASHRRHRSASTTHATTTAASTTPTTSTTTSSTATGVPAAATAPPPTADTLEAHGHELMLAGNYAAAIAVLRRAVATASPGSLTYAYALFDLGRSLRLAGDPQAAAVILQRRLQIPNQTGIVRHELELALRALGAKLQGSGGAPPAPGHGHGGGRD